jgi:transposase
MSKRKPGPSSQKKVRRSFTREFKEEAVRLVLEQKAPVAETARNLGIGENLLRRWKTEFEKSTESNSVSEDDRAELERLRAENRRLRMERDILKKATAFFANEKN